MNGLWATYHTTWIQPRLSARRARVRGRPSFPAHARYQLHAAQPGQHECTNSGANPAHASGGRPASAQCRPAVQAPWPGQRQVRPRRCRHTPSQAHAAYLVLIMAAGRTFRAPCRDGRGTGRPSRPRTQRCRPCVSPRHKHRIGPPGRAARRRPDRAGRDDLPYHIVVAAGPSRWGRPASVSHSSPSGVARAARNWARCVACATCWGLSRTHC
jgi:hypothetical protein